MPWSGKTPAPTKSVNELAKEGGQDRFRAQVGLPLATYFSGPKVKWLLENVPGLRAAADKGDAVFGNIDTWVIWNLTGGPHGGAHVTDVTNASRTMLMNLDGTRLGCRNPRRHERPALHAARHSPFQSTQIMAYPGGGPFGGDSRLWRPG